MKHTYDVLIRASIEIGGRFEADTLDEAIAQAQLELRADGEITDRNVERAILLDDEPVEMEP